jgi:hypothetical protein
MKYWKFVTLFATLALLIAASNSLALAQSDGYDLDWWTVDGGGASPPLGTGYTLAGTIGQPDAAAWQDTGYSLSGGFWISAALAAEEYAVYLPVVFRNFSGLALP